MAEPSRVTLPATTNQALGLGRFAIAFVHGAPGERGEPDPAVLDRTELFHLDAVLCGLSAIALGTNAPTVLRREALRYVVAAGESRWATPFGSSQRVHAEKAVLANAAAVREWDSNGTNFGYRPELGHTAGEFGHNDYYPACIAGAQWKGLDGPTALRAMVLLDEIRGRLAEVFSLKDCKIDHVLHGAVATAAAYGALVGASAEQIESAIGQVVAHHVPFRAIRAGHQLSDSKGASAAIAAEAAVLAVHRALDGFQGPADIFRNPEAIYRLFAGPGQLFQRVGAASANTRPADASPFDLVLSRAGDDFAVMGMHFKLGLYEHQSAGALHAVISLLARHPHLLDPPTGESIRNVRVAIYEPAFSIIADPAKRDPQTRQSADHSMPYIVATVLRKALESRRAGRGVGWRDLMLGPLDYTREAIHHPLTRQLMSRVEVVHGGPDYDRRYPEGIPTSVAITDAGGRTHDSGLVMFPPGHARHTTEDLRGLLEHKFRLLAAFVTDEPEALIARFGSLRALSAAQLATLHDIPLEPRTTFDQARSAGAPGQAHQSRPKGNATGLR